MKCTRLSVALFCLSLGSFAYAQTPPPPAPAPAPAPSGSTSGTQSGGTKAKNAQQQKMADCNAEAKTEKLTGKDQKDFMKVCLSKGVDAAKQETQTKNSQQEKMKKCNADATAQKLKGDARKQFLSNCLKASPSTN
jgi:hypothetical protein